jgi:RNA-directed DNA polymerase
VVVDADDLVILHADRGVVKRGQDVTSEWLQGMGWALKPSKTRIPHPLISTAGKPGVACLGFHSRQSPGGKTTSGKACRGRLHGVKPFSKPSQTAIRRHVDKLRKTIASQKHVAQETLIKALNPQMRGWSPYDAHVVSAKVFQRLDHTLDARLRGGAVFRQPNKPRPWITSQDWRVDDGRGWAFQPPTRGVGRARHADALIQRHVKVQGARSPDDGDWGYWSSRLGRHPEVTPRVARLLQPQQGKGRECGRYCMDGDTLAVEHICPKRDGGSDASANLQLLHRPCHIRKTARENGHTGTYDKRHVAEEPDERKRSCPVL